MKTIKVCLILALVCVCFASACSQGNGGGSASESATSGSAAGVTAGGVSSETATAAGQSTAPTDSGQSAAPPAPGDIRVTLIGDSVVLGAVDAVKAAVPGVDIRARNDRKLAGPGLNMLKREAAGGELGQIVALALGTNFVTRGDIDRAMEVIGPNRQVVFVNAYRANAGYINEVNKTISEAAEAHSSNFTIADWHGYVVSHPGTKLASDGCHLTKSSAVDYAKVIKAGVDRAAAKVAAALIVCQVNVVHADASNLPAPNSAFGSGSSSSSVPADSVTVIGDSVTLGAEMFANMEGRIEKTKGVSWCNVDSRVSRRLEAGMELVKKLKKKGKLGSIVVYALTTNGSFSYKAAKKARKAAGKHRYVIFVTGYNKGHAYPNRSNASIKKLAANYKNVFVADWNKVIREKGGKNLSDNRCHLNATSGRWYTNTVIKAIKKVREAKKDAKKREMKRSSGLGLGDATA
ncbi:MAG: hypothetical protein LBL05_10240 [Synergistaceae bacterium]|jgi:hypothetical protein|nr:hypothetical protein [Synergistaceae bacterium]